MKSRLSGAWSAALLCVSGCAVGRVAPPPRPPGISAAETNAPRTAEEVNSAQPVPVTEIAVEPAPASESAQAPQTASVPQAAPASEAAPPPRPAHQPLGWIAGEPLEPEELLVEWGDAASRELWLVINKLVSARLALAEAGRLGIRLAPEAVEERYASERAKLLKQIEKEAKGRSLEEFIQSELGFEPSRYLERVRKGTIRQMIAERAVRANSLASDSVTLRLIVAANEEGAEKVRAALASGRAFADVASELSVDDSRRNGGLVPYLVKEERSPLARLAFETPVGEVAGPVPIADHQFWIRVEERHTPLEGDWSVVQAPVEDSLKRFPIDDPEFAYWKMIMERRYPIDLGPLGSLIGATR